MTLCAAFFAAALTRAEIIERFRAPVAVRCDGLVAVFADCPSDMRLEYQNPIAGFAAEECERQYARARERRRRFAEPAISIHIGDVRTNDATVASRVLERRGGGRFTKITVPAPGYADVAALRREVAKAFHLAVLGAALDDAAAERAVVDADPEARIERAYADIERWSKEGAATGLDDEEMLKLSRTVLVPGRARPSDVLRFASRLYLYPASFDAPFCGEIQTCPFRDAIALAARDPRIRFAAYAKAPLVVAYGGGRGAELAAAADAYSNFLLELARGSKPAGELADMLDDADVKLNVAMETARKGE